MSKEDRERTEREIDEAAAGLTDAERGKVSEHRRLSAVTVYSIIRREGEEELRRPASSLWWSGIAAGLGISTSLLARGLLEAELGDAPRAGLIAGFGYTLGFVLVIVSRLQLFTENTIAVILPVLAEPRRRRIWRAGRLWGIVLVANLVGTFLMALLVSHAGPVSAAHVAGMMEVSCHFAEKAGSEAFVKGIPAGFLLAAIVWMLPSSKGFEIFVIILFTWLIAVGGFTHVVAGSTEMFMLVLAGQIGIATGMAELILPTLAGNIVGGTGLFALLAYAQVREEM